MQHLSHGNGSLSQVLIGFVLGDYFLFTSFSLSISQNFYVDHVPSLLLLQHFSGVLMLHESFTWLNFLGMILVLSGIAIVILKREEVDDKMTHGLNYPIKGLLLAFGGAAGQGYRSGIF